MKQLLASPKKDQQLGLLIGTIAPVLCSPIIAFLLHSYRPPKDVEGTTMRFWDFYLKLLSHDSQLPTFISLCALVNLLVFFILLRKKRDYVAKGIIFSTMAYALVFFCLKLL